jgi:hypothetical protein
MHISVIDINFMPVSLGEERRKDDLLLKSGKKLGYDLYSVFAGPMLMGPAKGDFSLRSESPALRLGFKNFNTTSFRLLPEFL